MSSSFKVGVVGTCGAGKSTLIRNLQAAGIDARHIAQEHSYVPYMWQRITHPDVLIYLSVSFQEATRRRFLNWSESDYQEQLRRLSHAFEHADLVVETDGVSPEEIARQVLAYLGKTG
jgi:deoxyadenosine/deoxycytidine kinase